MNAKYVIALLFISPALCRAAMPLDPYLLRPGDLPALCHPTTGFYSINEKTDLFYQYKVYKSVLPPALERHAQSFDCAGQKGTVYFFAYATADDAQSAELFAKPVVTRVPPAPLLREWSKGFVMVSFAEPPPELLKILESKLSGQQAPLLPAQSTTTVVFPAAEPVVTSSTTVELSTAPPAVSTISVPVPVPIISTPVAPTPAVVTAPVPEILPPPEPDLSDDVVKNMMKKVPCRGSDISEEGKALCDLLRDFRRGETLPAVIPADKPLMGVIYWVSKEGEITGPAYQAAVGSGRARQIAYVPLFAGNGVEEFESQALVESSRHHQAWPTNDITDRIAKHSRPDRATAYPTQGRSLVMPMSGDRRIYIREYRGAWILIGVSGNTAEEQMDTEATVAVLY